MKIACIQGFSTSYNLKKGRIQRFSIEYKLNISSITCFFDWIQIENLGVVDALPFNTLWKQELKNRCSVYLFRNAPHVSNAWLCTKTMLKKKCWWKHIPVLILHNCHQRQGKVQVYKQCVQNLSLIHIWRCRRSTLCRSRWSPYH